MNPKFISKMMKGGWDPYTFQMYNSICDAVGENLISEDVKLMLYEKLLKNIFTDGESDNTSRESEELSGYQNKNGIKRNIVRVE